MLVSNGSVALDALEVQLLGAATGAPVPAFLALGELQDMLRAQRAATDDALLCAVFRLMLEKTGARDIEPLSAPHTPHAPA